MNLSCSITPLTSQAVPVHQERRIELLGLGVLLYVCGFPKACYHEDENTQFTGTTRLKPAST